MEDKKWNENKALLKMPLLKMEDKKTKDVLKETSKKDKPNTVFDEIQLKIEKQYERDIVVAIKSNQQYVKKQIKEAPIKFRIQAHIQFEKPGDFDDVNNVWISTKQIALLTISDFNKEYNKAIERLTEAIAEANLRGSGWSVGEILELKLQTAKYNPIKGSAYFPLCKELQNKKAIINVQNKNDDKCFMWCVLAHLYPSTNHPERIKQYGEHVTKLNFKDISFPVQLEDIDEFEEQNDTYTINVYEWEDELKPIRISNNSPTIEKESEIRSYKNHIDLLLITDPNDPNHKHYTLIKNMSRLIRNVTGHHDTKYCCRRCLKRLNDIKQIDKHVKTCKSPTEVLTEEVLPEPGTEVFFKNICRQFKHPFIVYADFECFLIKEPSVSSNQTFTIQKHVPNSYGYVVVRSDGKAKDPVLYRGVNAANHFLEEMNKLYNEILKILKNPKDIIMTEQDERAFERATECHICGEKIDGKKVRDHDHITGKYRGAAHNKCNLEYGIKIKDYKLPIFFHNLRGYDSHIIMQAVTEEYKKIYLIAETDEKYKTFTLNKLAFYDSLQHLQSSLSRLAEGLNEYPITSKYFKDPSLIRKGVYPYEYMDCWTCFEETSLPPKECFYSTLLKKGITDEDYEHAQKVWKDLECETLGDYHDKYLLADVCLLADVFEEYRKTTLETFNLDPAHYISTPSMTWDAFLKSSKVNIDLISNMDMFNMINNGLRGGISCAFNKYCKANNKYLKDYDPNKPSNYIIYLDANNLYGWAMSEKLPLDDFKMIRISEDKQEKFKNEILNHPIDSEFGFFVEVDLDYPDELHDLHNDYPLAPERLTIDKQTKLIPNLFDKKKYVCHYRNLQFYVKHGLKIKYIHRLIRFRQECFLRKYIHKNTELRKQAKSDFEKDFRKLCNNSVFGKTMENPYNKKDIRLVTTTNQAIKLVAKPEYQGYKEFNESLYAISMKKKEVKLNKPVFIGVAVLELSKLLMYEFYYDYFKKKYPEAVVLYGDTDSLIINVPTEDIYKDMETELFHYDTSDYPKDHPLHSEENKKVIGKFKDELNGKPIEEYVGLRSKMYSILDVEREELNKAKGINKSAIKNKTIQHQNYIDTLNGVKQDTYSNTTIKSTKHNLETVIIDKKTLCADDNKRIFYTKEKSLAPGHYMNAITEDITNDLLNELITEELSATLL